MMTEQVYNYKSSFFLNEKSAYIFNFSDDLNCISYYNWHHNIVSLLMMIEQTFIYKSNFFFTRFRFKKV
jgi:hypothetical protein